ncbi:MAG: M1 family aminopeptidase, partial [Acidimicrobiales bacterium]
APAAETRPRYALGASIDPTTGLVEATMAAELPPTEGSSRHFRFYPGILDATSVRIDDVTVNREPVEATLDEGLITVPAPNGAATRVDLSFRYELPPISSPGMLDSMLGGSLDPADIGLLGRTDSMAMMGHWFPVWLPSEVSADPDPTGYGDIGAFPTAVICATVRTPAGFTVVSGGPDDDRTTVGDQTISRLSGVGLRDLALVVAADVQTVHRVVGDVTVRVVGDPEAPLDDVLTETVDSLVALNEAFGPYPWTELDVVATPLGAGVGGMEWPGMVWIEQGIFADDPLGMGGMVDMMEGLDLDGLGLDELNLDDLGLEAIDSVREWTVAHEVGHQWWHAVLGNDSIESPAVDEPLAQLAACVVMQARHPDTWQSLCEAQTVDTYRQSRQLGVEDAAAAQPSDAFDSSLQYAAVVYGKAPGFYLEVAELLGWEQLTDGLTTLIQEHPFELIGTDVVRDHLVEVAGDQGPAVADAWDRWFLQANGDQDLDVDPDAGVGGMLGDLGLGDLGLGDLGLDDLTDDLGLDTLLEDLDFEQIFEQIGEALGETE